jgi:hypothetical protein
MGAVPPKGVVYYEDGEDTANDINTLLVKRARLCKEQLLDSKQPIVNVQNVLAMTGARVVLRRVYFLNEEWCRYISLGFYPSENYQVLVAFGGPRNPPITLIEHHFRTFVEALPALCEATQQGELYTRKDCSFLLRSSKPNNCARLYRDKKCVSFTLTDLCYVQTKLHMVEPN